jgi:hypothetical protein
MYGDYDSHIVFATRANILASVSSTTPSGMASQVNRTLAYCFSRKSQVRSPQSRINPWLTLDSGLKTWVTKTRSFGG